MDSFSIGKKIRDSRLHAHMTLDEVAKRAGVHKSTVQRYEKGKFKDIKLPVIQAISNAINVNPSWVIGKSQNKEPNYDPSSKFDSEDCSLDTVSDLPDIIVYKGKKIELNSLTDDQKDDVIKYIEFIISKNN